MTIPRRLSGWAREALLVALRGERRSVDWSRLACDVLDTLEALQRVELSVSGSETPGQGRIDVVDQGEFLTVAEAAVLRGCTTRTVRNALESGRLRGRRAGRAWLIDASDFETYRFGRGN